VRSINQADTIRKDCSRYPRGPSRLNDELLARPPAMTTLIGTVLNPAERALLVRALGCLLTYITRQNPTDEIAAQECIQLAMRLRTVPREQH
jgi:hypothetical protein